MRVICILAVPCLVAACAPSAEPPAYEPVADVKQLMNTILEPAAEAYWDAVGWILDGSGTHEIAPASSEEWEAVRNAAFVIAESGNLLLMDGRAPDREAWAAMSRALIATGRRAIAAAEAQDTEGVFTIGGEVYEACTACHAAYAIETLRPSDARR
ncbi:MAG: hypothetical protein L0271_27975 [Gemmatimonadetes bacterium]|nr:hypothetical protein [Gemmatimonadota bacterium]